jgi:hypothetical protein
MGCYKCNDCRIVQENRINVLVSHEKELETYVDNIFQISKENGLSKIVKMN